MIVDIDSLAGSDYITLIPTKGRGGKIDNVEKLFPYAYLYMNEDEVDDYAGTTLDIITHKCTKGYAEVLNSVFDMCKLHKIKYAAIFDDDKWKFSCLVGNRQRDFDSGRTQEAIENACQILEDLDENLYLFSTASSIIKYQQNEPVKAGFSLPQGAMVVRSENMNKMRVGMHYYEDFDWLMDYIKKNKYIIIENRFLCISKGDLNSGGCNSFRTRKNEESSRTYVKNKWGQYVNFVRNNSGAIRPTCMKKFRQKL